MKTLHSKPWRWALSVGILVGLMAGCDSSEDQRLTNDNPGGNNLNVVVAFGDSITRGSNCDCTPYPARLASLIGKQVVNTGIPGRRAQDSVGYTRTVISQHRPAFMLILYGVNDVIHGYQTTSIRDALSEMVDICLANNVVPVLATYPIPMEKRTIYAGGTYALNTSIRTLAAAKGIRCVDLEMEFNQNPDYYEPDGLHPNDLGTQLMALAFADLF